MKKRMKHIFGYVWQMIKSALPSGLMYLCAGTVLFMQAGKSDLQWSNKILGWTIGCLVAVAAYNALMAWALGGSHYEMLVSGNVKRASMDAYGNEYKMSSHKIAKEYRVWKGFVIGGVIAVFPLITGIVFAATVPTVKVEDFSPWTLIGFLLSGWSVLPVTCLNQTGAGISYLVSCLFGLIPVVTTGVFYIVGAYGRRNKAVRQQMLADKMAEEQENKPKKINYGGLPGTKPKKRK